MTLPNPNRAALTNLDQINADLPTDQMYDHYQFSVGYARDEGIAVLPLQGPAVPMNGAVPAPSCRFIRKRSRISFMVITWSAVRRGCPPEVPDPEFCVASVYPNLPTTDPSVSNFVFLKMQIGMLVPLPRGDTIVGVSWALGGKYVYGMSVALDLNNGLPSGVYPWDTARAKADAIFPAQYFNGSLFGSAGYGNNQNPAYPVNLATPSWNDPSIAQQDIQAATQAASAAGQAGEQTVQQAITGVTISAGSPIPEP
jgi:hypothetical protein